VSAAARARNPWLVRGLVAAVAGLIAGAGGGVLGLRLLQGDAPPPAPVEVEAEPVPEAPRRQIRGPRADGMRGGGEAGLVGSGALATRDSVAVVPDLVGRVEGDARRLLERAGFTVGEIMFREDDNPIGTVLQTFPVPGERVSLPATVNLILADRRRRVDTSTPDTRFGVPDTLTATTDSLHLDSLFVLPDTLP
jgi:hypothetical protein